MKKKNAPHEKSIEKTMKCIARILTDANNQGPFQNKSGCPVHKSYCVLLTDSHLTHSSNYPCRVTQNLPYGNIPSL